MTSLIKAFCRMYIVTACTTVFRACAILKSLVRKGITGLSELSVLRKIKAYKRRRKKFR